MFTNNILDLIEFSKTKLGYKYIQTIELNTLIPPIFIKKYNPKDSIIKKQIPVFFNIKSETFGFFLADNFFNDIHFKEFDFKPSTNSILLKSKTNEIDYENIFFGFNSIKELINDYQNENSDFMKFKTKLDIHLLNIENGEKVIILSFETAKNNESLGNIDREFLNNTSQFYNLPQGITTKFEFFKAIKFNNTYYLIDENNQINQTTFFKFNKNSEKNINTLVLPYSEEDFEILTKILEKTTEIQNNIKNLFNQQKTNNLLDSPFKEELLLQNIQNKKRPWYQTILNVSFKKTISLIYDFIIFIKRLLILLI